jgi:hypothetical protein
MNDLDELRRALAEETGDLRFDLPTDRIRRRARRVRARRTATVVAALVLALAVPAGVLAARPERHVPDKGRPAPVCVTPGADGTVPWVGAPVQVLAGASFEGIGVHQVLVGATYTVDRPALTVVFRHEATGVDEYGLVSALRRTPDGGFTTEDPADAERRFAIVRVNYGNVLTIDLGLYAGLTDRITVTAGNTTTVASTVVNRETGWTLFWLAREPTDADAPVRVDVLDDNGRVAESAPGTPGPGLWVKPSSNPSPPPVFNPTC